MKDELNSSKKNQVSELLDLPFGHKSIDKKLLLKIKCNANGIVVKGKSCMLVNIYLKRGYRV